MTFTYDPEFAEAIAPMAEAMAQATPPVVGDIEGRRCHQHDSGWVLPPDKVQPWPRRRPQRPGNRIADIVNARVQR